MRGQLALSAEIAHERPMFRKPLRERRCLVPADCFYEWKETLAEKIPHTVRLFSEDPFFLAGLQGCLACGSLCCSPYPSVEMIAYPVSTRVNNVKNEGAQLIERVG